ncbi:hypothetical protein D3C87_256990 [compost metagenome]
MKFVVLAFMTLLFSDAVQAAPACRHIFSFNPEVLEIVDADPVKQWLSWEQNSNAKQFVKAETPIPVPVSRVEKDSVNIHYLDSTPAALKNIIEYNGGINWFKHPFNTYTGVPHYRAPEFTKLTTYFTASRSLALILGKHVFTLKTATDNPHGFNQVSQPGKATTREDIQDGIHRMEYIERIDKLIGTDPSVILAKEIAMVADKATGEGYLFRDLSFLNDGHYYLPALSIPYVGKRIAELHKENPDVFWGQHYAALLGKAKAILALRYGLQMETPNAQNMLIQLDHNLRPTGKIVFRDLSDTAMVSSIAKGLGEEAALRHDAKFGVKNTDNIRPFWGLSVSLFDEAGGQSISRSTLTEWGRLHNEAYLKEFKKALGLDMMRFKEIDRNVEVYQLLTSDPVQKKLRSYRLKLEKEYALKNSAE